LNLVYIEPVKLLRVDIKTDVSELLRKFYKITLLPVDINELIMRHELS